MGWVVSELLEVVPLAVAADLARRQQCLGGGSRGSCCRRCLCRGCRGSSPSDRRRCRRSKSKGYRVDSRRNTAQRKRPRYACSGRNWPRVPATWHFPSEGHEDAHQQRNNRDDDKQFDESEGRSTSARSRMVCRTHTNNSLEVNKLHKYSAIHGGYSHATVILRCGAVLRNHRGDTSRPLAWAGACLYIPSRRVIEGMAPCSTAQ